eukprot:TRINITY_DN7082_c0_g1_i4.p1 TRINITY_DN7082_c0_g1~~TRINITY_DN7082_c0_g1_i4.p1  ORF type:complete len:424 (+),score=101.29 TRINITY_DN7082_c0_g1_i4:508-1779(+)
MKETIARIQSEAQKLCTSRSDAVKKKNSMLFFFELAQQWRELQGLTCALQKEANTSQEQITEMHLHLTNLQYEAEQNLRSIRTQSLENVQVDQALQRFVKIEGNLDHLDLLKTLENELKERIEMQAHLSELKEQQNTLSQLNEKKLRYLEEMSSKIKNFTSSSLPIMEYLNLGNSLQKREYEPSSLFFSLPTPLFNLYNLLSVYMEAYKEEGHVSISILGDKNDSGDANTGHSLSSLSTEEERNSYAYKKHFLSLLWILRLDNGKEVAMVVDYYVCLKIVTIRTIAWNNINNDDVMQGNIVSSSGDSGLLVGLFPCDEGLTTPNLSNLYLFRKYRKSFQFSPPAVSGRPYLWLQALCGLNFSPDPSQSLLRRVQNANPLFQLFVPPSRYLPDKKSEVEDDAFVVRLLVRNLIEKIENHVRHKI